MTTVCEYPSLLIEGETIRVECDHTGYHLCRLDRRGRRIRACTMDISPTTAAAHTMLARVRGGWVDTKAQRALCGPASARGLIDAPVPSMVAS